MQSRLRSGTSQADDQIYNDKKCNELPWTQVIDDDVRNKLCQTQNFLSENLWHTLLLDVL